MQYERFEAPLPAELVAELSEFWQPLAGVEHEELQGVLTGRERAFNLNMLYLAREGGRVVGTTHLTIPRSLPALGGLGEVQTAEDFRRKGVATQLCDQACREMQRRSGEVVFLGTGNPAAARVYHRLGWRKQAGAAVMANVLGGGSPEAFLVDFFSGGGPVTVTPATPADRIAIIPLLVSPHDWQGLDLNARMYSTRYVVQRSCMGLYPKYDAIARDGRGQWFAARASDGKVVGLSTARIDTAGRGWVDGFTHKQFDGSWAELIRLAMRWSADCGATFHAAVSVEDEEKRRGFDSLGFREVGAGDDLDLDGRAVGSVRLEAPADAA